mmetsp:Transcript_1250/g.2305  ORF Transcript_1250/g.2305 Transcript_1250/m.2305 type:complete len:204 (+) Transcript_1250:105-716(+)
MTDSPSWLSPDEGGAAAPAPATKTESFEISGNEGAAPAPSASNTSSPDDADLPGIILMMRLTNMGVAVALMACSIVLMTTLPSLSNWVLAVYATCGGLLVCCLETQLKYVRVIIALNFGFLFDALYRFLYYLLMASVAYAYDNLFGKIVAVALVAVAFFNTYVLCRYPSYRKVRERIAEEEDKRIEARISKEVKKQAVNQITK